MAYPYFCFISSWLETSSWCEKHLAFNLMFVIVAYSDFLLPQSKLKTEQKKAKNYFDMRAHLNGIQRDILKIILFVSKRASQHLVFQSAFKCLAYTGSEVDEVITIQQSLFAFQIAKVIFASVEIPCWSKMISTEG